MCALHYIVNVIIIDTSVYSVCSVSLVREDLLSYFVAPSQRPVFG